MKALLAAALLCLLFAGCGGPATTQVTVNVLSTGFSGGNVTVQVWDPSNAQKVDLAFTMQPGQNLTIANFEGPVGGYTARASAGINARVQEDIQFGKGARTLTVLATDGGVQFSLDGGRTPA